MTKRKPGRPKKTGKKKPKKKGNSILRRVIGLSLLLVFVFLAGVFTHHTIIKKGSGQTAAQKKKDAQARTKIPAFEIYPQKELPPDKPIPTPRTKKLPRVAIIIDDLGYDSRIAEKILELDAPVTLSILPFSPFQNKIYRKTKKYSAEIMLHLPMEPMEYPRVDPGPGALLTSMSPDKLIAQLIKSLDTLPSAKGVNNHMGSKMTTMSNQMYQIFSILKKRNMFFIDSRTTAESLSRPSARLLKIPFAQRDIFLDHVQDAEFIRKQLQKLVRIAIRHGTAIGIGHPHPVTIEVLREELPKLKNKVELVPASAVVHVIGS
jgi:uncharacterized protein